MFKQELNLMLVEQNKRLNVLRFFAYQGFAYILLLFIGLFLVLIGSVLPFYPIYIVFTIILGILMFGMMVLNIVWIVRRLHDINFSGYWILVPIFFLFIRLIFSQLPLPENTKYILVMIALSISVLTYLGIFILTLIPGTKGTNKYGEIPPPNNLFVRIFFVVFLIILVVMIISEILMPDTNDEQNELAQRNTFNKTLALNLNQPT